MTTADPLGSLIQSLLERRGLSERMRAYQAWRYWAEAVGPQIAQQAQPLRIRDGVLEIRVGHPVWMQQLQLLKPKLLKQLNAHLGEGTLKDLYFRRGTVSHPADRQPAPAARPWQQIPLEETDQAPIEQALATVEDPELKARLRRLLQRQRQLDKFRQSE